MPRKLSWYDVCLSGKKPYPTKEHAQTALLSTKIARALRREGHRHEVRAYQCDRCGRWHLTSLDAWRVA